MQAAENVLNDYDATIESLKHVETTLHIHLYVPARPCRLVSSSRMMAMQFLEVGAIREMRFTSYF